MGASYVAIACSLDALASVHCSRDEALFARVLSARDTQVRHYLDAGSRRGGRAPADLLAEIFRGAPLTASPPHGYAYTLLACAYVLGVGVGAYDCSYGRAGNLTAALGALGEPEEAVPLFMDEWPLPDLAPEEGPWCATLPADKVARLATETRALVERVRPALIAKGDDLSLDLLVFFTECYEAATQRGADLFMVSH